MTKLINIKPTKENNVKKITKLISNLNDAKALEIDFGAKGLVVDSINPDGSFFVNAPITLKDLNSEEIILDEGQPVGTPPIPDYMKFKYNENKAMLVRAAYGREAMYGRLDSKTALEEGSTAHLEQLAEKNKIEEVTFSKAPVVSMFGEAAGLAPFMMEALANGLHTGLYFGGGYALTAGIAGQIPPLTAAPEELITVPAAFAAGMANGMAFGIVKTTLDVEGGSLFLDLLLSFSYYQAKY